MSNRRPDFSDLKASDTQAWLRVVPDVGLLLATASTAAAASDPRIGLILAAVSGVFIARLFVLGHDACHGSLFATPRLNRLFGLLLLLPSGVTRANWIVGHNVGHHGLTNLGTDGGDRVWRPVTRDAYLRLSRPERLAERFWRSPLGISAYFAVRLWLPELIVPRAVERKRGGGREFALLVVFVSLWGAATATLGLRYGVGAASGVLFGMILPWTVWVIIKSWVIFLHHTHPRVEWSFLDDRSTKRQPRSQRAVLWETPLNGLLHNILLHPAHHLNVLIPSYRLKEATRRLDEAGVALVRERLTLERVLQVVRACKVFDTEWCCWSPFPKTQP